MRIAVATPEFVSENNFHGGLANYTYKLAKWLIAQKHEVKVFLAQDVDEPIKQTNEFFFDGIPICKVHIPDQRWRIKSWLSKIGCSFLFTDKFKFKIYHHQVAYYLNKEIKRQHQNIKFHVAHYPHLGGLLNYKPKDLPGVIRLSSSTALCQQMGGYGEADLKVVIQEEFEIKAMKKADAVFGPSKSVIAETEKKVKRKIELIETPFIPPPGELDHSFYENNLRDKKYLLFFGSVGLIKGVATIAEIIFELFDKHKELHFVFVGKKLANNIGSITVWEYLLNKAGVYQDRIIHFESLKHPQLFPVIQHSEMVVLPSRTDNFPNTCIEAMANHKIVIGTYHNGFDQLIEDGKNGYLINADDHVALLSKLEEGLHLNEELKKNMESLAGVRINKLSPDIVLNRVLDLYKKVMRA